MGRLDAIRLAERPKMHGRAMLSGPSGAGKTWTALSMARVLVDGDMSKVLVIDTERESALTYADVFVGFAHLPWRPPYDPTELTEVYASMGERYEVVITDSFTHFWRGQGGTLDIADGKIGGWKAARPIQEALVEAVLSVPAHMMLCVRSKTEYLIENGGKTVTKLGVAPMQDDTLVYEMNVAFDLDLEHRITVTKSRTPAVPVGRMYPAGLEKKAAEDYAAWLAGGVPPANRDDVERIVGRFGDFADAERRKQVKGEFVQLFGMPHSLTAAQVAEASAWLEEQLGADPDDTVEPPAPDVTPPTDPPAAENPTPPAPPPTATSGELTFDERIALLPADLAELVRGDQKKILDRGVEPKSKEHVDGVLASFEQAEKAQTKRAKDIAIWFQGIGVKTDDDRHQLIHTITDGAVSSARKTTQDHHRAIKRAVREHQNGTALIERQADGTFTIRQAVAS